jgi:hypothetical protein
MTRIAGVEAALAPGTDANPLLDPQAAGGLREPQGRPDVFHAEVDVVEVRTELQVLARRIEAGKDGVIAVEVVAAA